MSLLGWLSATLGLGFLLVAALGLVRLPDALSRQHAATKAATLAVSLFALGLALVALDSGWGWDWVIRLLLMVLILSATLPLASHALARAARAETQADK